MIFIVTVLCMNTQGFQQSHDIRGGRGRDGYNIIIFLIKISNYINALVVRASLRGGEGGMCSTSCACRGERES